MVSGSPRNSPKQSKPRAKKRLRSADGCGPQLVSETRFMQQYRIGAPVHGGGDIAALQDGLHHVEVFTVGTDSQIYDFYADASSSTGMQSAPTGLFASKVTAGRNAAGRIVLLAAKELAIQYVVENAPGSSTRWGAVQTAQLPLPFGAVKISDIDVGQIGGALYVGALIETKAAGPSPATYAFVYSIWDDAPGVFQTTTMTLSTLNCVWSGISAETAEFTCLDTVYLGYNIALRKVVRYPFAATFNSLAVATVVDGASNNRYFAILNDGNLYQMVGGSGGAPFSWAQLTQQQRYRGVAAAADQEGQIHLFTLGSAGALWHLSPRPTSPIGFTNPMVIQSGVALMTATALDEGNIQLFAITTSQATMLQLMWQAGAGNWQISPVQVPTSGQVEPYISYSTDLQIINAVGSPVPRAVVEVRASSQAQITVNGAFYTIDAHTPATLVASAAGTLTITQQTNALAIPSLSFDIAEVTTAGEPLVVRQYAGTRERLATVTGPDLMNARKHNGGYLLSEQYRAPETTNSLAQACNQTMSMIGAESAILGSSPMFRRRGGKPGVGVLKGKLSQLERIVRDPGRDGPHWQLDFSGGKVEYRALTAAQAGALIAEERASYPSHLAASDGLGWIGSIGDFIAGIAEGVLDVVRTVISTVGDAIHAAIRFIANGVIYLFETVVELIEQAFDLVEVIFGNVSVFFGDLFEWLGFIFNWNDILRTRTALAYTANQFLDFLPLSVGGIQREFDREIAKLQNQIGEIFDQLVAAVGGSTLGGYIDSNEPDEPSYAEASANNIILSSTLDNASGASYTPLDPGPRDPFDAVMRAITELADTVQNSEAFSQALSYMTNLGGSLDQIFVQLASALFRVVQGLVEAMLSGVQAVVDAILQLVPQFIAGIRQMLNEQWDIPFVTQFYAWITGGSPLTLLDLLSLMIAVPATLLYKITTGAAPFPDDASVAAFEASFNAQTILANSGLGDNGAHTARAGMAEQSKALVAAEAGALAVWEKLLLLAGCVSSCLFGLMAAGMDSRPTTNSGVVDPFVKKWTKIALVLEIAAQAATCPWIFGAGKPNCSNAAGADRWLWIYELFGVALDAGFWRYEEAFPENNNTNRGIIIAGVYGAGHTVVTAILFHKLTGLGQVSKIALLFPECCKLLKLRESPTSLCVLAALDWIGTWTSGIASFADSVSSASVAARPERDRLSGRLASIPALHGPTWQKG